MYTLFTVITIQIIIRRQLQFQSFVWNYWQAKIVQEEPRQITRTGENFTPFCKHFAKKNKNYYPRANTRDTNKIKFPARSFRRLVKGKKKEEKKTERKHKVPFNPFETSVQRSANAVEFLTRPKSLFRSFPPCSSLRLPFSAIPLFN